MKKLVFLVTLMVTLMVCSSYSLGGKTSQSHIEGKKCFCFCLEGKL